MVDTFFLGRGHAEVEGKISAKSLHGLEVQVLNGEATDLSTSKAVKIARHHKRRYLPHQSLWSFVFEVPACFFSRRKARFAKGCLDRSDVVHTQARVIHKFASHV